MLLDLNDDTPGVFYSAAKRLQIAQYGPSYDNFTLDVFYYQSCYLRFTYILKTSRNKEEIHKIEGIKSAETKISRVKNA